MEGSGLGARCAEVERRAGGTGVVAFQTFALGDELIGLAVRDTGSCK